MKKVFLLLIFLANACIFSSFNKDELNDLNNYNGDQGIASCFGADGKKKFEFNTAGLPQHAVFVYNYK